MHAFFRAALAYALAALAVSFWLYQDAADLAANAMVETAENARLMLGITRVAAPVLVPAVLIALILAGGKALLRRAGPVLLALAGVIAIQIGFAFLKNAIPLLVPYYADPGLARLDAWLHGGADPWIAAHRWISGFDVRPWLVIYLDVWTIPAMILPILFVATDSDPARAGRYCWLYFGSWLLIGNLLALAGSSVGPVYYDLLTGEARFAGLNAALTASGIADSSIGVLQSALWERYETGVLAPGLGISAFPSMHVAVAAITALWLAERSLWLAPLGLAFVLAILFLSVLTGYHYAVDGYASIAAVGVLWWALRRDSGLVHRLWRSPMHRLWRGLQSHRDALISRGDPARSRLPRSFR
jgi:hypothetical protein